MIDEEEKKEEVNAPACKEVEDLARSKLSNTYFDFVMKKLKLCAGGVIDMDSNHIVSKEARNTTKPYEVKNAEHSNYTSNTISTTNQSSTNLVRNEENKISFLKLRTPEFLFGSMLPIDVAITLTHERKNRVVAQTPNATSCNALGNSIVLGRADGAEMDSLPKTRKSTTTLSIVHVSHSLT